MGGLVAQRFAIDHPDRTRGLVLLGTFATLKGHPDVQAMWDGTLATLVDPVDPAFVREFQESTLARPIPPAQLDTFVAESLKVPARVWRATFRDFLDHDFSAESRRITAPTLVISGDKDALRRPRRSAIALAAAIRGATVVDYPDFGHAMHWERSGGHRGARSRASSTGCPARRRPTNRDVIEGVMETVIEEGHTGVWCGRQVQTAA